MTERDEVFDNLFGSVAAEAYAKEGFIHDDPSSRRRPWGYQSAWGRTHPHSIRRATERIAPETTAEDRLASIEAALNEIRGIVEDIQVRMGEDVWPAELSVVPGFVLKRPIPIIVEESEDDVIAHWVETELMGVGDSEFSALASLTENIQEVWSDLLNEPGTLHVHTQRMLDILRQYVSETT